MTEPARQFTDTETRKALDLLSALRRRISSLEVSVTGTGFAKDRDLEEVRLLHTELSERTRQLDDLIMDAFNDEPEDGEMT